MYDLLTVGSATEDVFVIVHDAKVVCIEDARSETSYLALPRGAKLSVDHLEVMTGGGATNVAVAAKLMGLNTGCVCKVGMDGPGRRVVEELRGYGVGTDLVLYSQELRTGYSVLITDYSGERTVLVHRGATCELSMDELCLDMLAQTQWLYVGSLRGPAAQVFFDLPAFAAERGIKLAINPGDTQLSLGMEGLAPVLAHTEIIFVNKEEAYQLTGVQPERTRDDEQQMMRMLHEAGCRYVVITEGAEGSSGYDGESYYLVPAYDAEVASTVGAGDSFAAGCLAGLHRGLTLPEAMKIGAINASHVIRRIGAKNGLLTWDEAIRALAEAEARG